MKCQARQFPSPWHPDILERDAQSSRAPFFADTPGPAAGPRWKGCPLKTREFLENLPELVRQQLPPELSEFHAIHPFGTLTKLHYGLPTVHYEVWIQRRKGLMEVGLHFEGDRQENLNSLELLRERSTDIRKAVGPGLEFEEWDKGWTRIHETLRLEALDMDFLVEISFKLSAMIRTLEPLLHPHGFRG